jgi:DNA-binding MarR family transcriptional regulator
MSLENVVNNVPLHELGLAQMFMTRSMDDFSQSLAQEFDISSIEWLVLSVVNKESPTGGVRVTDLAAIFEVKTTYITMILNNLRSKAYVDTRYDTRDARVRLTVISTKGSRMLAQIERYARQTIVRRMQGVISAGEFKHYVSALVKLAQAR